MRDSSPLVRFSSTIAPLTSGEHAPVTGPEGYTTISWTLQGNYYSRLPSKQLGISPLSVSALEFVATEMPTLMSEMITPLPFEEWCSRYPLTRREQLRDAYTNITQLNLLPNNKKTVKNFLKMEATTKTSDPRNISPRSDEMLSVLGPAISALEHKLVDAPFLVKGQTLGGRTKKMTPLQEYDRFIETDYSRFDMSISAELQNQVELICILSAFDESSHPLLYSCMFDTINTKGVSGYGLKYFTHGGRCSGDAHTSIGNGLINRFATWLALKDLPHFSIHEGDDGVIGVYDDDLDEVAHRMGLIPCLGLQAKADVYSNLSEVSFCGRHLHNTGPTIIEHCDIMRSWVKFHTTVSNGKAAPLALAKARSYCHTDLNTPIIGPLAYSIYKVLKEEVSSSAVKRALLTSRGDYSWSFSQLLSDDITIREVLRKEIPPPDVSESARVSCYLRTGIAPAQQLMYEQQYYAWVEQGYISEVAHKHHVDWEVAGDATVFTSDL